MKAIGKKINSTVKELKLGQMELDFKVIINKDKKKVYNYEIL